LAYNYLFKKLFFTQFGAAKIFFSELKITLIFNYFRNPHKKALQKYSFQTRIHNTPLK